MRSSHSSSTGPITYADGTVQTTAAATSTGDSSTSDLNLASGSGGGAGDIIFSTKTVERGRFTTGGIYQLTGDGTSTAKQQVLFAKTSAVTSAMIDYRENGFLGTADPSLYMGVNQDANGNVVTAGQPGLSWAIEGDYDDGTGTHKMEAYLQHVTSAGVATRPLFIQLARTTGAVTALALTGPDVRLVDSTDSTVKVQTSASGINLFPAVVAQPSGNKTLNLYADGTNGTQFKMAYAGTLDVLRFQTDSTTQAELRVGGNTLLQMYSNRCLSVGGDNVNSYKLYVSNTNGVVGDIVTVIKAKASQTGDLTQWWDSSSNVLLRVQAAGHVQLGEAVNIVAGTTTGTKIGTLGGASGQKLGFFNATPIVQPVLATGGGATVDNVITALQNLGLVRQS